MSTITNPSRADAPTPPTFDVDLWRDRIQAAILRQMPGITFGPVTMVESDDAYPFRRNPYFFIFEVAPDVLSVQDDLAEMDDLLDSHLTATIHYLMNSGEPFPYTNLMCDLKHIDCIRQQMRFADAVQGFILANVMTESKSENPCPQ